VQANCPQCGQRITVDDARAPDKPFGVRCPKCSATVRFQGRAPAAAAPEPAPAPPAAAQRPDPSPAALPPVPVEPPRPADAAPRAEEMRAQVAAQIRREMGGADGPGRALVALPDPNLAAATALLLARQGFAVDTVEDPADGLRLLEQGAYAVVTTARLASASPRGETLYQRVCRLSPDARRRVFLLLVGDEFRGGDVTQAFVAQADLVLHARDAGHADALLRAAFDERQHLYQGYLDARRRAETSAG
jgi:hypothetical protein